MIKRTGKEGTGREGCEVIRKVGKEFRGVGKEGTGREGLRVMRKGGKGFRAWEPSVAQDTKYS